MHGKGRDVGERERALSHRREGGTVRRLRCPCEWWEAGEKCRLRRMICAHSFALVCAAMGTRVRTWIVTSIMLKSQSDLGGSGLCVHANDAEIWIHTDQCGIVG